jgi:hypothetical protein
MYTVRNDGFTIDNTTTDILTIANASTKCLRVHNIRVTQNGSTAAGATAVKFLRRSTAGSGGSSATVVKHSPGDASAGFTATASRTTQGTAGDVLWQEGQDERAGWNRIPTPEERWEVEPSGIIALCWADTPTAGLVATAEITVEEIG